MKNIVNIIKDALILLLITCVVGGLLGATYVLTKNAREAQEEKAKNEAYLTVIPNAVNFTSLTFDSASVESAINESLSLTTSEVVIDEIILGLDKNNEIIGYAVTVTSKEGYGGEISFTIGFTTDYTITTLSFLSISETAGMGMKATEDDFISQFEGDLVQSYTVVKEGSSNTEEIDAISGATITSKAVTNAVNAALVTVRTVGGETNEN